MAILLKFFMSFMTIIVLPFIYLVSHQIYILDIFFNKSGLLFNCLSILIYFFVIIILVLLNLLLLNICKPIPKIENIKSKEPYDGTMIPSYLGYFFVGLSIPYCENDNSGFFILCIVCFIITVFIYCSGALYYNPFLLLFGYRTYKITDKDDVVYYVILKDQNHNKIEKKIEGLVMINDYTYMENTKKGEKSGK